MFSINERNSRIEILGMALGSAYSRICASIIRPVRDQHEIVSDSLGRF